MEQTTLVLGATGKTGRRLAERLERWGMPVRRGSRSGEPPFDWHDRSTWAPALAGMHAVYITYQPDLTVPGADDAIAGITEEAVAAGVQRLVLLAGRGEPEAEMCEKFVHGSGLEWVVLRPSWFFQNFDEGYMAEPVRRGEVALPAGGTPEPFVDADDIADVALAALTDDRHLGATYELTSPRLLTFEEAIAEIAAATGRDIRYRDITPQEYVAALEAQHVPKDFIWLLDYLFTTILDGRNAHVADGVQRALDREPRDFRDYVRDTAATGAWNPPKPLR